MAVLLPPASSSSVDAVASEGGSVRSSMPSGALET